MSAKTLENNFMSDYFDLQKKIINSWQGFCPTMETENSKKVKNDQLMESYQAFLKKSYDSFFNMLNPLSKGSSDNRFFNAMDTYQSVYRFWEDLVTKTAKKDLFNVDSFYNSWKDSYTNLFSADWIQNPLQFQELLKEPLEISQMLFNTQWNFFQPWIDDSEAFQKILEKSISGDKNAALDYIKLFRKDYEKTYGKFFDVPVLGMSRQHFEKQLQSMDSYLSYLNALNEFFATINKVGSETMETIVKEYQNMLENGTQPKTFKEFYEYWWKQNEEAYLNLFKTDDFSQLLGHVVDASVILKKNFDKYLEEQLDFLPFSKNSDMKSLYKTVYDLKKQVKSLNSKVDELIEKADIKGGSNSCSAAE